VLLEVVAAAVLHLGHVGGKGGAGFEGAVDHHLEHVYSVVFDAGCFVHSLLLIIRHFEFASTHLNHAVVDCLICMFECLQIYILQTQQRP